MVMASAEAIAIIGYAKDLGMFLECEMLADSSAALGIAQRAGVGKVRHLRTQGLWVQEVRASGRIAYKKVLGTKNPADLLTKHLVGEIIDKHIEAIGQEFREGRAEAAPAVSSLELAAIESYTQSYWADDEYSSDGGEDLGCLKVEGVKRMQGKQKIKKVIGFELNPEVRTFISAVTSIPTTTATTGASTTPARPAAGGSQRRPQRLRSREAAQLKKIGAAENEGVEASQSSLTASRTTLSGGRQCMPPPKCEECGDAQRVRVGWCNFEDDAVCVGCAKSWGCGSLELEIPVKNERGRFRRKAIGHVPEGELSVRSSSIVGSPVRGSGESAVRFTSERIRGVSRATCKSVYVGLKGASD